MPEAEDAVILCGGAGLRLLPVTGGVPKSLARVSGRPFLEVLLRQLQRHGFSRVVLATGYQGSAIRTQFGEAFGEVRLAYSEEPSPLGTGGALRHAAGHFRSACCLAMNGDSYTDVDLGELVAAHRTSKADLSIVVAPADGRADSGAIRIDSSGSVLQFAEKESPPLPSGPYLNCGIYVLSRQVLFGIPTEVPISLERELFPNWIHQGLSVKAFVHCGRCLDIGTPDRYLAAQTLLANVEVDSPAREVVPE